MSAFDDLNKKLGLQVLSSLEMNKIHFETGQHSPVVSSGGNTAMPIQAHKATLA